MKFLAGKKTVAVEWRKREKMERWNAVKKGQLNEVLYSKTKLRVMQCIIFKWVIGLDRLMEREVTDL